MTDKPKKDDASQGESLRELAGISSDRLFNSAKIEPKAGGITVSLVAPMPKLSAFLTSTGNSSVSTSEPTIAAFVSGSLDAPTFDGLAAFDDKTEQLRKEIRKVALALKNVGENEEEANKLKEKWGDLNTEYQKRIRLGSLINQLRPEAHSQWEQLTRELLATDGFGAFVISMDIRRSTELMLKARSPTDFGKFLRVLCTDLMSTISDQYGVVDKFTGDGVLGYFPEFLAGSDAGFRALTAADSCHKLFTQRYRESRNCFKAILADVGLGIGVDYGCIHVLDMPDGLTVVGEPVVYACRLSDGPAGGTYLNEIAYEKLMPKYASCYSEDETKILFKHDGSMVAHVLQRNSLRFEAAAPDWLKT